MMCIGVTIKRNTYTNALMRLFSDYDKLDDAINELRHRLKQKVDTLRDLEHKEGIRGFDLHALSKQELRSLDSLL